MHGARASLLFVVLFTLGAVTADAADVHRVLLLHAFGHPYSPWSDEAGAFRAELIKRSPGQIELYEASLDTGRVRDVQTEEPFVRYIRALLSGRDPDLLVPAGAPAAFFMQRHRASLFPSTPMLVMGADVRRVPLPTLSNNDTAVSTKLDLPALLTNILRVRPQTTSVAVVVGNSPVERYWTAELHHDFEPFAGRVSILWLNNLTFSEMLNRAATMPPNSAILWILLSEDAAGVTYAQDRALEKMREVSSVPIFGLGDYELGRGIVGGPLIPTQSLGREAADVALRILNGARPGDINPPPVVFEAPAYDSRELRRWNISESRLPPNSIVQFREPTVWQQYRWEMVAIAAVVLGQSLLILYVLLQSRLRRAAEAEAAEQRREVTHLMRVSTLGELSGAIAHEINQPLAAILSNAQAALYLLAQQSPDIIEVRDALNDIVHEDNRAANVIGRLRNLLKKGERKFERVDVNELVDSTVKLLHSELIMRRVEVQTDLASGLPPTSGDPVQLQQVLLNLLMNGMDAMAMTVDGQRRVKVSTRTTEVGAIEVLIRDRGPGIKVESKDDLFKPFYTSKEHGLGLGLTICSSIAQAHGGKLSLANHPHRGAVATLSLPAHETLLAAE